MEAEQSSTLAAGGGAGRSSGTKFSGARCGREGRGSAEGFALTETDQKITCSHRREAKRSSQVQGYGLPSGCLLEGTQSQHSPAGCCCLPGPCKLLQKTKAPKELPARAQECAFLWEFLPTGF